MCKKLVLQFYCRDCLRRSPDRVVFETCPKEECRGVSIDMAVDDHIPVPKMCDDCCRAKQALRPRHESYREPERVRDTELDQVNLEERRPSRRLLAEYPASCRGSEPSARSPGPSAGSPGPSARPPGPRNRAGFSPANLSSAAPRQRAWDEHPASSRESGFPGGRQDGTHTTGQPSYARDLGPAVQLQTRIGFCGRRQYRVVRI